MKIREFEAKINNLAKRANAIEKKQTERFPHLIERLDRIENSFPAVVERLNDLERSILRFERLQNKEQMDYSGAFESDIDYG